jgi:hypothetical protein
MSRGYHGSVRVRPGIPASPLASGAGPRPGSGRPNGSSRGTLPGRTPHGVSHRHYSARRLWTGSSARRPSGPRPESRARGPRRCSCTPGGACTGTPRDRPCFREAARARLPRRDDAVRIPVYPGFAVRVRDNRGHAAPPGCDSVVGCRNVTPRDTVRRIRFPRDDHHGDLGGVHFAFEAAEHLLPRNIGQPQVQQDDLGVHARRKQGRVARRRGQRRMPGFPEIPRQD